MYPAINRVIAGQYTFMARSGNAIDTTVLNNSATATYTRASRILTSSSHLIKTMIA